jgi:hypothetical protein
MPDLDTMAQRIIDHPLSPPPSIEELRLRTRHRRARQRRRRSLVAAGGIVAIVVVLLVSTLSPGAAPPGRPTGPSARLAAYLVTAGQVPDTVLEQVGLPSQVSAPTSLVGQPPLTADGKPTVVYVGGEYCPFCAVARWELAIALSKFGTFTDVDQAVTSSSTDVFPGVKSWSFQGATYTSPYIVFEPAELYSSTPATSGPTAGHYTHLDTLTAMQQQAYNAHDSGTALPFIDIDNRALVLGAPTSPGVLTGLSLDQIATGLSTASSPVAQALDGAANYLIASLCTVVGANAASICHAPFVEAAHR